MQQSNHEELAQKIISLISNQTSISPEKIGLSSDLGGDLGIDGDDAVELLAEYAKEFSVNIDDFPYYEYFGAEAGGSPLSFIMRLFGKGEKLKPLLVRDLVEATTTGNLT